MARHNYISLYCSALKEPKIKDISGTKQRGTMVVRALKGYRNSGDEDTQIKVTYPLIATSDKKMIDIMQNIKENDIVLIKGNIITLKTQKGSICPECEHENIIDSTITYINPINIVITHTGLTEKESLEIIARDREISNEVCVIGHLSTDPEKIPVLKNTTVIQYKIGIPRKFRIRSDSEEVKSDFPMVKVYGDNALMDLKAIHTGSTVLIDGYLQGRKFICKRECIHCGNKYEVEEKSLEIVPYQTEYLRNYNEDAIKE